MRLLLDTHALLWWVLDHPNLTVPAEQAIGSEAAEVYVSSVSAFEIAFKVRIGKLPEAVLLAANMEQEIASEGFAALPLSLHHAVFAGALPFAHRDPFDRLLIAQAVLEDLVLVSNERIFDQTGVRRLW